MRTTTATAAHFLLQSWLALLFLMMKVMLISNTSKVTVEAFQTSTRRQQQQQQQQKWLPRCKTIASTTPAQRHIDAGAPRFLRMTTTTTTTSSSTTTTSSTTRRRSSSSSSSKRKKSLQDRTADEVRDLIRDVFRALIDAGPRAGPRRTIQAYRAFIQTVGEFATRSQPLGNKSSVSIPAVLRTLFEKLGATYIKLGQFIASSPTIFPKEYVIEFQKCLDQTEALPWTTIQRVIENELGGSIDQHFSYVDPKPLASASIAQVHAAKLLRTGEDVVIKVQKPGIDQSLKADLAFVYVSARILEFIQPDFERTSLSAVAGDIRDSMLDELDFQKEAMNNMEFLRFIQDNGLNYRVTAPRVFLNLTTKKVLTMERLFGVSMLDETTIQKVSNDPNVGINAILTALNIWSMTVTQMPWFHADVHAGNLLLLQDGRVAFIDFGIVGRISQKVLQSVDELSIALAMSDYKNMARALCNMGATESTVDIDQFALDIERVMKRMDNVQADVTVMASEDGTGIQGKIDIDENDITNLLLEFVEVTENNGLKLPREFGLLVKQSLYFDRYLKILAPDVDVMNDDRVMLGGKYSTMNNPRTHNGEKMDETDNSKDRVIDV